MNTDSDIKNLEGLELNHINQLFLLQEKKHFDKNIKDSIRQRFLIDDLLKENKSEDAIIRSILYSMANNPNINRSELNDFVNHKNVKDNLNYILLKHITEFKEELRRLKSLIDKEVDSGIDRKMFKEQSNTLNKLREILKNISKEESNIMNYYNDFKTTDYQKNWIRAGHHISQVISGILLDIDIIGEENIPKIGPAILAPHHVHSRIDEIVMKAVIKRDLHFVAAAEGFFIAPFAKNIFLKGGVMPVMRKEDDFGPRIRPINEKAVKLAKEYEIKTLKTCIRILKYGECLVIYPEGDSLDKPTFGRVGPFIKPQTGFVYFQALMKKQYNVNVPIIPTGLKYLDQSYRRIRIVMGSPVYFPSDLASLSLEKIKPLLQAYANRVFEEVKRLSL